MSHYQLTEQQMHNIERARGLHLLVIDLACCHPNNLAVTIDPDALADLLCVARDLLPTEKNTPYVAGK